MALKSVEEAYLSLYIFLLAGENGSVDSIHRSSEKNVELTFYPGDSALSGSTFAHNPGRVVNKFIRGYLLHVSRCHDDSK